MGWVGWECAPWPIPAVLDQRRTSVKPSRTVTHQQLAKSPICGTIPAQPGTQTVWNTVDSTAPVLRRSTNRNKTEEQWNVDE